MNTSKQSRGFTLVEILVVLVIATVVLTIAIPRIRTINKERNIRETARVVGSAFANASQRAIIDGTAGVRIKRNTNFNQGGFEFAATEISLLRAVPPYRGDAEDAEISNADGDDYHIDIDYPLEQDSLNLVQIGDAISFNNSSILYRITNLYPGQAEGGSGDTSKLRLELEDGGPTAIPAPLRPVYLPGPADEASFVIHRSPRLLRSSTTSLPADYIIDLRFSGFEVLDEAGTLTTVFEPELGGAANDNTIDFIFDGEGAVDKVQYTDPTTDAVVASRLPLRSTYFYVTEAPDSVEMTDPVASSDETGLWVSVSSSTGSTNIGYNNSSAALGQTYQSMSNLFNTDRAAFNTMMSDSRANTASSSANQ